jgi:hypothetical protein
MFSESLPEKHAAQVWDLASHIWVDNGLTPLAIYSPFFDEMDALINANGFHAEINSMAVGGPLVIIDESESE